MVTSELLIWQFISYHSPWERRTEGLFNARSGCTEASHLETRTLPTLSEVLYSLNLNGYFYSAQKTYPLLTAKLQTLPSNDFIFFSFTEMPRQKKLPSHW